MEKTPRFIQIASAGTSGSHRLYGLTAEGFVYMWTRVEKNGIYQDKWVLLENQG